MGGMAAMGRTFRAVACSLFFVLAYAVAIVATPFAVVVLIVAWIIHKLKLTDEDKTLSTASMVGFFVVAVSMWVVNLVCIPFVLFWFWILGKPTPHPLD